MANVFVVHSGVRKLPGVKEALDTVDEKVCSCPEKTADDIQDDICNEVFRDERVLQIAGEQSDAGGASDDVAVSCQTVSSDDNPSAKAVVFSLRNQVGGLVRALRVFKVSSSGRIACDFCWE